MIIMNFFPYLEIYSEGDEDVGTDGQISVTTRYMMPEAWAELYFEYGRNDAAGSIRDFALIPQHSRAYILELPNLSRLKKNIKLFR